MQVLTHRRRLFVLGRADAQPRRVFPPADTIPDTSFWRPVDLTAAGVLLIEVEARCSSHRAAELVEVADLNHNVYPFAVNDAGTVAALSWDGPSPGARTGILLAGSQGGAASCPRHRRRRPDAGPDADRDCAGGALSQRLRRRRRRIDRRAGGDGALPARPVSGSQTCDAGGELNISVLIRRTR
jgi:hypothetical protein